MHGQGINTYTHFLPRRENGHLPTSAPAHWSCRPPPQRSQARPSSGWSSLLPLLGIFSIKCPLLAYTVPYNPSLNWIFPICFIHLSLSFDLKKKKKVDKSLLVWRRGEGKAGDLHLGDQPGAATVKRVTAASSHYPRAGGKPVGVKIQPIFH